MTSHFWLLPSNFLVAHAFAERYDLPLPLWYYLVGAGAAVVLSFVIALRFVGLHTEAAPAEFDLTRLRIWRAAANPLTRRLASVFSVAIFAAVIAAGFIGPQGDPLDNLLPVTIWVVWWVGLTYACALVGDVWRALDPVQTMFNWMTARSRRPGAPTDEAAARAAPLEIWPAVALFFAFTAAEIAWPENAVPVKLALAILLYAGVAWTGMAMIGVDRWLATCDPFAQFFGLVGRFAPIDTARRTARAVGAGLVSRAPAAPSMTAFVMLVLSSVSFDGLRETPFWNSWSSAVMAWLYRAGLLGVLGNVTAGALVKVAGLALLPVVFWLLYLAVSRVSAGILARSGTEGWTSGRFARQFVLSLVPIAIAYHLAHYLSYLLIQGQSAIPLLSDPFGLGWNLFGTRFYEPDIAIVGARFVWTTSVVTIVLGHVAAVFVAHATALEVIGNARQAVRSQYPLLVLMVGYTMFSLWVLSQPIVER